MTSHGQTAPDRARFTWVATARPAGDFVYAEFPIRAAAFLVDLLLGAAVTFVGAFVLGRTLYPLGSLPAFEGTAPLELLMLAVVAALPTAAAVWFWRSRGQTPGQALFRLEVQHWQTGERLSLSAAFARWVLLFAPLILLVGYPQVVASAFDPGGFLILVELPWLPFVTMTLPLLWYLALAYSALADRSRVRGMHDRVTGSVVVCHTSPRARPAPVPEGDQPLSDLVPFIWLRRLGLREAFAVAAVIVGAERMVSLAGTPIDAQALGLAAYELASVVAVLLPAALLWRVPDAASRQPLLVVGLGLTAALVVVGTVARWLSGDVAGSAITLPLAWLYAAAPAVVGLGLLTLRERGPNRPLLLIVVAALLVLASVAPWLINGASPSVFEVGTLAVYAVASALGVWVAITAWLDGDRPRTFWTMLAIAMSLPLLVSVAAGVPVLAGTFEQQAAWQPVLSVIGGSGALAGALLLLVAYGRLAPREERNADAAQG